MALAAIAAGKHVYCEKPLALDASEAREIAEAAERAGVMHMIGFNYSLQPVDAGRAVDDRGGRHRQGPGLQRPLSRGLHGRPGRAVQLALRAPLAGAGALADLGSHLINMAHVLLGPIDRVFASLETVHAKRRVPATGEMLPVENEDVARAFVRFARVPRQLRDQPRRDRLQVRTRLRRFRQPGQHRLRPGAHERAALLFGADPPGRRGFRTILAGPEHPDYAHFCPAPGHGLGINDLKVIEVRNLLRAIADGEPAKPDFDEGLRVQQVMEAIERSHASGAWTDV